MQRYSRITGTGSYLPEKVLTNHDLAQIIDTSDEWIVSRSGIRERHVAAPGETTSDMAQRAVERALAAAGRNPDDVDLIIVATTTPDMVFPSTACILQRKLGVTRGFAFDVQAVCSGFMYALSAADLYVKSGQARCAVVVGSEIYSRIIDWNDRGTCVLFGDGAGAVVLEPADTPGIYSTHLHSDGRYSEILSVPGWVNRGEIDGRPLLQMDGQAVFKFAVKALGDVADEALSANGFDHAALDWLVPHQANIRIIQSTAKRLKMSLDKVVVTVDRHGNTSAASVPLALDEAVRDGRIQPGHLVMLEGIGGGFAWGAALLRW